jgi:hypothetical protein
MTKDLTAISEVLGLEQEVSNAELAITNEVALANTAMVVEAEVAPTGTMVHHRWMKPREPEQVVQKRPAPINRVARERVKDTVPSSNPATLTFPTDRYGMTKDVKKTFVTMVSRIAGDPAKRKLVDDTMAVLLEHLELRYTSDVAYKQKLAERDRLNREQADA